MYFKEISEVSNTGSFDWKIPSGLEGCPNYSIFIMAKDNSASAFSPQFLIIPTINLPSYNIILIFGIIIFSSILIIYSKKPFRKKL